ncbi:hypothetical protein FD04_GL001561 [Secundilactobacillus odoratitofui DSM 19909 = JCM 15043]|uniref:HTH lysR-type domain-containing protein n=1 Tax=Secundilactobacillus odoratitofui DSM 19909 = JCM 15043 TaxID=1423776 RepID=A0A0R1LNR0_9LACO|nr:LysR family transcriptional regulator [Secundilactobacillus odoratitofui]KRK97532.1 hypothetical protein FD04_GL001561 [Secundilactobacillus odoratitofui DSM 19909 = JCM 15043]
MPVIEIRQLITFQMIVSTHSYSKAAVQLGYTQSTISMQMRKLEAEIGQTLLKYDQHRVHLTAAGHALMPLVERLLQDYGTVQQFAATQQQVGQLKVAAPESLTVTMVATALQQFKQQHPQVEVKLQNATCLHNEEALIRGDVDVALMMWPSQPKAQLIDHDLGEQEMVLVTNRPHQHFSELLRSSAATFIINEPDCSYRNQFETAVWQGHQRLFPTIMLPSIAAIKSVVATGLGFSYLPRVMVESELRAGVLFACETAIENHIHAHLVTRPDNVNTMLIEDFVRLFKTVKR